MHFLVFTVAGWLNRHQEDLIDYLREENWVLREQLGSRPLAHGLGPAPERRQRTPWKTFLETHWEGLASADLFTVEVLTLDGLRRYLALFAIELKTRYTHIAGIHRQPDGSWMEQAAVDEYVEHYHRERNHQGRHNRLLRPLHSTASTAGNVRRRARLGGLLNYYSREAA